MSTKKRVARHQARTAARGREQKTAAEKQTLVVELSPQARQQLAKLQLESLDRQGRQPGAAQLIEKLINAAAGSASQPPYPA